ncbi:hypothetical protein SDC9_161175 [bioreactor metagenome]|uniref:Uncharacterized protein n=1 Tax=bioreactor metagenome TaxID=1076179 RepID=A0A645FKI6_9ZZZZ
MGNGALSSAGGADHGGYLSLARKKRDVLQGLLFLRGFIGEGNPSKLHLTAAAGSRHVGFWQLRPGQHLVHPLHAAGNLHGGAGDVHDLHHHRGHRGRKQQIENEGHGVGGVILGM